MSNLPPEIEKQISDRCDKLTEKLYADSRFNTVYIQGFEDGHESGATEWAGRANDLAKALEAVRNIASWIDNDEKQKNLIIERIETALAKYKEAGGEAGKTFTVDEVDAMLIEFALMYHKNPQKDIANDAAEYLSDKIKEVTNG